MTQMKAIQFSAFGDTGVLALVDIPRPVPAAGQLLVRQQGSSINPVDLMIRRGGYPSVPPKLLPYVGGRDVGGVVEAVGEGVDMGWIGRPVFGAPDFSRGAFAECIVMGTEEVAEVPDGLTPREAALLPIAALTAWQGLFRQGGLQAGETVLIHGGSGGVGHYAVQMAARAGVKVIATASERNKDFLSAQGAERVVAYDTEEFDEVLADVDLVLDLIGGETQQRSWRILKEGGRLISAVAAPDAESAREKKAKVAKFFIAESRQDDLLRIAAEVAAGTLKSHVAQWCPLAEVPAAQAALEEGGIRGKIGVEIG